MEFFLNDPNIQRFPPKETHIRELGADPYPDGTRLRVTLELTPFQQRPTIELQLVDPEGQEAASASIIEPASWKLELTLHIRTSATPGGAYKLLAHLNYPEEGEVDRREVSIQVKPQNI
jgi:hypothetical protein